MFDDNENTIEWFVFESKVVQIRACSKAVLYVE